MSGGREPCWTIWNDYDYERCVYRIGASWRDQETGGVVYEIPHQALIDMGAWVLRIFGKAPAAASTFERGTDAEWTTVGTSVAKRHDEASDLPPLPRCETLFSFQLDEPIDENGPGECLPPSDYGMEGAIPLPPCDGSIPPDPRDWATQNRRICDLLAGRRAERDR